jgi:hypothetical protein
MTLEQISQIHKTIGEKSDQELCDAANLVLEISGQEPCVSDKETAITLLRGLLSLFLDSDDYLKAAALIWPEHAFDPRPQFTQDIFKTIHEENQLLIQGANSTGKSYSVTAWMYLDWRRDPYFTMIKMAAVNEEHLKRTIIAQVKQFHALSVIDLGLPVVDSELYFGLQGFPDMGIAGVLLPQGAEGTGRIRGYKPKPIRKVKHPRFGFSSRVRFFGDEGQIYKDSVFKDFGSMQSAMNGPDPVKIVVTFNPDLTERAVLKKAMPSQGWLIEELDTLYKWRSKEGYSVLRLDGAKSENVVSRKIIYPGLQSLEGYMKFVQGGGDTSADYFEKARGFPPLKNAVNIIIPASWPTEYRGMANFIERPETYATVDCSYQGEDGAVMTIGRYGQAAGWTKENGQKVLFTDYLSPGTPKPKHVLQYDQQIPLMNRDDTVALAEEIVEKCKAMKIAPENVGIDGTGNGFGTYSHLKRYFGDVVFIQWASKATERKVLNEDQAGANTIYDSIISEMWFSLKRWMESGCVFISPIVNHSPLNQELTTRRFSRVRAGLTHVESKREYKSRGNGSPDFADSMIMMPFVIRSRHPVLPGIQMESETPITERQNFSKPDPEEPKNLEQNWGEQVKHLQAYEVSP